MAEFSEFPHNNPEDPRGERPQGQPYEMWDPMTAHDLPPTASFGIEDFQGYEPQPEELPVAARVLNESIEAAYNAYPDYVLRTPDEYVMTVNYIDDHFGASFTLATLRDHDRRMVESQFLDLEVPVDTYAASTNRYKHIVTPGIVVRQLAVNPELLDVPLPRFGEVSIAQHDAAVDRAVAALQPTREFQDEVFPPELVGAGEAERIANLLKQAEPEQRPFHALQEMAINRAMALTAGNEVPVSDARIGAKVYTAAMRRYLAKPENPHTHQLEVKGATLDLEIVDGRPGQPPRVRLGSHLPLSEAGAAGIVHLLQDHPLSEASNRILGRGEMPPDIQFASMDTTLEYEVRKGQLFCVFESSATGVDGRAVPIMTYNGRVHLDEAWGLNLFLRKPSL
jgi:hypothetical protein